MVLPSTAVSHILIPPVYQRHDTRRIIRRGDLCPRLYVAMPQLFTSSTRTYSNLYIHFSNLAAPPPGSNTPHILLLHGFLSTHADLLSLASSLQPLNLPLILPDIPLHGCSRHCRPASLPHAARILASALTEMCPACQDAPLKLIIVGYSMGGRLAMELVSLLEQGNYGLSVISLVLISAALPPRTMTKVDERRRNGAIISGSIEHVAGNHAFQHWLEEWYSRSIWGHLKYCSAYEPMIQRKLIIFDDARVEEWATASRVMADYEKPYSHKLRVPAMYVHGTLDEKYKRVADTVTEAFTQCAVVGVEGVGHNVVVEAEEELSNLINRFVMAALKENGHVVEISRLFRMEYSIGLKREMVVGGKSLRSREGVLVVVESTEGVRGIGDVCPLPGLHEEHIETCVNEVDTASLRLIGVTLRKESTSLEQLEDVLSDVSGVSKCGLTAAILHMLTRAWCIDLNAVLTILLLNSPCPALGDIAGLFDRLEQVEVNGVLPRLQKSEENSNLVHTGDLDFQYFSRISPFRALKLKVGMTDSPFQEGKDCFEVAWQAAGRGQQIRLDANCAWTKMEFRSFRDGLGRSSADVEFIEEPLRSVDELVEYLEEESISCGTDLAHLTLNIALDESLSESPLEVIQEVASFPIVSNFVIKPAVIGSITRVLSLCKVAQECGCKIVMSTVFESGVGIAWTALLASVLGTKGTCHGLGTYDYLSRDVTEGSFQEACILDTSRVSVRSCWRFLEQAAEHVVKTTSDKTRDVKPIASDTKCAMFNV